MAIIAVDCDDTLSLTNETICAWHNRIYGTDLSIEDYHHFQYWRVKGWGDMSQTVTKVQQFNSSGNFSTIPPIPSAVSATKYLRDSGHKLVIITARMANTAAHTVEWLEKHFPNTFSEIVFTSAFESANPTDPNHAAASDIPEAKPGSIPYRSIPKPKSEVIKMLGAQLLVDDSIENAFDVHENAGIPVCLYGPWNWNKTAIDYAAAKSPLSYQQRRDMGDVDVQDPAVLPDGITRTLHWDEAVKLIDEAVAAKQNNGSIEKH